jgi:hypothetical protein
MSELIFIVEEAPEEGLTARGFGASIFSQADIWGELRADVGRPDRARRRATLD